MGFISLCLPHFSKILSGSVLSFVFGISVQISQMELGMKCLHPGLCKRGLQDWSPAQAMREGLPAGRGIGPMPLGLTQLQGLLAKEVQATPTF